MKVRMLTTIKGAEDGIHVKEYKAGQEYDIVPALALVFIGEKVAAEVAEKKEPIFEREVQAVVDAPKPARVKKG